jgi:hypothetical protein
VAIFTITLLLNFYLKLLDVLAAIDHPQANVQLVKIATLYFHSNYDEFFPKLKYFSVYIFGYP